MAKKNPQAKALANKLFRQRVACDRKRRLKAGYTKHKACKLLDNG